VPEAGVVERPGSPERVVGRDDGAIGLVLPGAVVDRLKSGKYKYKGAERTFSTRFTYASVVTTDQADSLEGEVVRLLGEHPEWAGNEKLNRLMLVHTPEQGYFTDDETSPYYLVKRRLLEAGIPCQMVDTGTLRNADYKDLNLALNIIAKCGLTLWVLPENIPDADFFIRAVVHRIQGRPKNPRLRQRVQQLWTLAVLCREHDGI
jgi:hypothetical protein